MSEPPGEGTTRSLQPDLELERSPVVANSAMNRERGLLGPNSYTKDLSFDVLSFLKERLRERGRVAWLDLCCGSGRALIQAGERLRETGSLGSVLLHGVDLIPAFPPVPLQLTTVRLEAASLTTWKPGEDAAPFDLITCVHGLHYLGDKLGLVERAVSWLAADGLFLAHLDPENLRLSDGAPAGRGVLKALRAAGLAFDTRRRQLSCAGKKALRLPFRYLGADDRAGPNCTGQPAVNSYYAPE